MKVKEKAAFFSELWLHVNAGGEGMQVRYLLTWSLQQPATIVLYIRVICDQNNDVD